MESLLTFNCWPFSSQVAGDAGIPVCVSCVCVCVLSVQVVGGASTINSLPHGAEFVCKQTSVLD